jgi:hypothetical protein
MRFSARCGLAAGKQIRNQCYSDLRKPRSIFATAPIHRMLVAAAFNVNQRNGVRDLLIKSFFEERHREFAAVLAMS